MPRLATSLALVCLLAAAGAQAQTADTANPDIQFAQQAASGGHAEVDAGRMALDKSRRQDVREFAQRMIDDHGKVNTELSLLAQDKHLRLPQRPVGEDAKALKKLSALSGADFDRAYAAQMVEDHHKVVDAFQREADSGGIVPLKTLAGKTLPTLKEHLSMAERLQQSVGEEKAQAGPPPRGSNQPPQ